MTMMYAINAFGLLRVSADGEMQGLDLHEHGIPAYPEYAMHGAAQPQGAPAFTQDAYNRVAQSVGSPAAMSTVAGSQRP